MNRQMFPEFSTEAFPRMFEKIIRHIAFPVKERLGNRKELPELFRSMLKTQYWAQERIRLLQTRKLKHLLIHAFERSDYYRNQFDQSDFNPYHFDELSQIKKIPILTKRDLKENLADILDKTKCDPIQLKQDHCRDNLFHSVSGGTTGPSIDVFNDQHSLTEKVAAQLRFDSWSGWRIGDWFGLIWPAVVDHHDPKKKFKSQLKNYLYDRIIALQQTTIEESHFKAFFSELRRRKATLIRGFPYQVVEGAAYCNAHHLRFSSLKGLITTGEPLYPNQRKEIESAFSCKVFDSYRTREVGCVAQECEEHNGYHISADTVYIETAPVDEGSSLRQRAPSHQKLLVTDLTNFSAPLIRYEIGDVGSISEHGCPCGRGLPLLCDIGGRISDLLFTPEGNKVSPVTVIPNLFHLIGIMNQFQIIQDSYNHITIKLVKPAPENTLIELQKENIMKIFGTEMKVSYKLVDQIEPLASGKYSFVISKIRN